MEFSFSITSDAYAVSRLHNWDCNKMKTAFLVEQGRGVYFRIRRNKIIVSQL
jgi:hypothetical protein